MSCCGAKRLAVDEVVADSATLTAIELVVSSFAVNLVNGRLYQLRSNTNWNSTVDGDVIIGRIREDNAAGNQLQIGKVTAIQASVGSGYPLYMMRDFIAAATGSKTFVLTGVIFTGTGNMRLEAAANQPSYFELWRI